MLTKDIISLQQFLVSQFVGLLAQFVGLSADVNSETSQGILIAFMTALEIGNLHDSLIIDFDATYHMSNKLTKIYLISILFILSLWLMREVL